MSSSVWLSLAVLLAFIGWQLLQQRGKAHPEEVHRLVDAGAQLIDVRSPEEFAAGHLPNARNIPVSELSKQLSTLGDKSKPVVVYCRSGARSARAAGELKAAGFSNVHDLGAMSRW